MTVIYNAKSHVSVIFSLHGSVLPSVLPWCIYNSVVAAVVWVLAKRHVVDLSFSGGGSGYTFLSVLVSFFTVTNIGTTYSRFWEARGHLGNALNAAELTAHRAAVYTRKETHEKAKAWRTALRKLLTQMLRNMVYTIEEEPGLLSVS
jgi:predicted membrane chloride channel (bestrophin family)